MKIRTFLAVVCAWQSAAWSMDLPAFLKAVESKHKTIQSLDMSIEAAEDRRQAGDVELVPLLSASVMKSDDKKFPNQFFQFGGTETKTTAYSLGLNKKFSTGTHIGLSANAVEIENPGVSLGSFQLPAGVYLDKFGTGSLGLSVSQSLWKDFFGNATRLRHERELQTSAVEKGNYDLQKKLLLIAAEASYWEYIYAQEDVKITRSSLERSKRIEAWVRRRTNDGISDRADLLQAQGLVAQRQLQLISSMDNQMSAQKVVRDFLELSSTETLPTIEGNISQARPFQGGLKGGKVVQLEAYLASLQAKAKTASSQEVVDMYRPDLVLQGAYNTNSYDQTLTKAVSHWADSDKPTTSVGVNFTYLFDTDVKGAAQGAARKDALAAKYLSERKLIDSESLWSELNRHYAEQSKKILAAENISKISTDRAKAEAEKFNKGRSITSNVVDSEQQAADAELNLTRLKTEQRKLEAQGRLFITLED